MPITEARKKANQKWDKENMATIACRLRKEQVEEFKRIAERQGKTANQMIREYVFAVLEKDIEENP